MDLPPKIKEIEDKVVRNELDKALTLIKEYSEVHKIEVIRTESLTQLSNLSNIERLKRTNQMDEGDYLVQKSKLSTGVLALKTQLVYYIENPAEVPTTPIPVLSTEENAAPSSPTSVANHFTAETNPSTDWFKKILLVLFALAGGALIYFIVMGEIFQMASSMATVAAIWGAKIYDDNAKYRRQKLLLNQ